MYKCEPHQTLSLLLCNSLLLAHANYRSISPRARKVSGPISLEQEEGQEWAPGAWSDGQIAVLKERVVGQARPRHV
jgi:hypothetical protein